MEVEFLDGASGSKRTSDGGLWRNEPKRSRWMAPDGGQDPPAPTVPPVQATAEDDPLAEYERVEIVHVVSNNELYVRDQDMINRAAIMDELCAKQLKVNVDRNSVVEQQMYLARQEDNWYRVLVLQAGIIFCRVVLVDVGRTEQILKTDMYEIADDVRWCSPGVIECALHDAQLLPNCAEKFLSFMEHVRKHTQKLMAMVRHGESMMKPKAYVDLLCEPDMLCTSVSVREMLFYHSICVPTGKYVTLVRSKVNVRQVTNQLTALQTKTPTPLATEEIKQKVDYRCIMTHFETADLFYLQPTDWITTYQVLLSDMKVYYDNQSADNYATLVAVGQIYAMRHRHPYLEHCIKWYRGRITKVTNDGQCEMFAVDIGRKFWLQKDDVFYLAEQFANIPVGTIKCRLGNVRPVDEQWSEKATAAFRMRCLGENQYTARFLGWDTDRYGVTAILEDRFRVTDLSKELVGLGFAVMVGPESDDEELDPEIANFAEVLYKKLAEQRMYEIYGTEDGRAPLTAEQLHAKSFVRLELDEFGNDIVPDDEGPSAKQRSLSFESLEFDCSSPQDCTPHEGPSQYGYPVYTIPEHITGFYCEVTNFVEPFVLSVYPHISAHEQMMDDMHNTVQKYIAVPRPCAEIERYQTCVAYYKHDCQWYRGYIDDYKSGSSHADVLFVDHLNVDSVHLPDIYLSSIKLRSIPLRNVMVTLPNYGIPVDEYRDPEPYQAIVNRILKLFEGKTMYARILHRRECLTEIDLYTDELCRTRVLERLLHQGQVLYRPEVVSY